MQAGVDRYLKENGCDFFIGKDIAFQESRDMLQRRAKYLRKELGIGNNIHAVDNFSPEKEGEEQLWKSGQLGTHNAHALVATMYMNLTQHLGLRGRQEHHSMKITDFTFGVDDCGNRYVTFAESVTKTLGRALHKNVWKKKPKIYQTRVPGRCPIYVFDQFLLRRPFDLRNEGNLCLAIIPNPTSGIWFKRYNLGVHSLIL